MPRDDVASRPWSTSNERLATPSIRAFAATSLASSRNCLRTSVSFWFYEISKVYPKLKPRSN